MPPLLPRSTLFPYTTLFRSSPSCDVHSCAGLKKIVQKQYGSAFEISVTHKGRSVLLRSEEHTSELQSHHDLVCRLLLEKKNTYHHDVARMPSRIHRQTSLMV